MHSVYLRYIPFEQIVVMNTCDPVDGVLACNDDGDGCFGGTSVTGAIRLEKDVRTYFVGTWLCDFGG